MSRKSRSAPAATGATTTDRPRAASRVAGLALVPVGAGMTVGTEALLTPREVAALFRVDPKTVSRWAEAGKLSAVRTLGGHRRFREAEVRALVAQPPAAVPVDPLPRHQAS